MIKIIDGQMYYDGILVATLVNPSAVVITEKFKTKIDNIGRDSGYDAGYDDGYEDGCIEG